MRRVAIVGLCLVLGGCGTKYQEMGFTGGVAAQQMTADTRRIQARGNGYTNSSTVQDYVLLKAAETTQAAGGTHFQIISAADASRASTIVTPGTSSTTFVGNGTTEQRAYHRSIEVLRTQLGKLLTGSGALISSTQMVRSSTSRTHRRQ